MFLDKREIQSMIKKGDENLKIARAYYKPHLHCGNKINQSEAKVLILLTFITVRYAALCKMLVPPQAN